MASIGHVLAESSQRCELRNRLIPYLWLRLSMRPVHLYLTGYRGCGKSTVARLLADRLHLPLIDTDLLVEQAAGKSIAEIFEQDGEPLFREIEAKVVQQLAQSNQAAVIALGGGAILRDSSRNWIRESGWVVWLMASPETLAQRIAGDATTNSRRPSLSNLGVLEEVRAILAKREPLYNVVSHVEYDTQACSMTELAECIADDYLRYVKAQGDAAC